MFLSPDGGFHLKYVQEVNYFLLILEVKINNCLIKTIIHYSLLLFILHMNRWLLPDNLVRLSVLHQQLPATFSRPPAERRSPTLYQPMASQAHLALRPITTQQAQTDHPQAGVSGQERAEL